MDDLDVHQVGSSALSADGNGTSKKEIEPDMVQMNHANPATSKTLPGEPKCCCDVACKTFNPRVSCC